MLLELLFSASILFLFNVRRPGFLISVLYVSAVRAVNDTIWTVFIFYISRSLDFRSVCLLNFHWTGLFKKKCTLSKIYFTKTTDVKSISCVRMERKSLKVLISMIWSGTSLRLWLLLPVTCCDECGKSWIIDLTSTASHVGLTSSACKVWK
jgi:hypothetical protein